MGGTGGTAGPPNATSPVGVSGRDSAAAFDLTNRVLETSFPARSFFLLGLVFREGNQLHPALRALASLGEDARALRAHGADPPVLGGGGGGGGGRRRGSRATEGVGRGGRLGLGVVLA